MKIAAAELKTPTPVEADDAEPTPEGFSTALAAILASAPTSLARVPTVRPTAGGWSGAETEPPPADFAPAGADGAAIALGAGAAPVTLGADPIVTTPGALGGAEPTTGAPVDALDRDPDASPPAKATDGKTPDVSPPSPDASDVQAADGKATEGTPSASRPAETTTAGQEATHRESGAETARADTAERPGSGESAGPDAGASHDESSHDRGERSGVHRVAEPSPMNASELLEGASDASAEGPRLDAHGLTSAEPLREAPKDAPVVASPAPLPTEEAELPEGVKWSLLRDAAGQDHARVTLEHPTLGTLRLDFAMLDDGIDVRVLAPSLLSALRLESDEDRIRELLEERGARLAALRVSIDRHREPPRAAPQFPRRAQPGRISTEA